MKNIENNKKNTLYGTRTAIILALVIVCIGAIYSVSWIAQAIETSGGLLDTATPDTGYFGEKLQAKANLRILSLNKTAESNAVECRILDYYNNSLGNSTFVNNRCNFSVPIEILNQSIFFALTSGTNNASFTHDQTAGAIAYPITTSNLIWLKGAIRRVGAEANEYNNVFEINNITTQRMDYTQMYVETNLIYPINQIILPNQTIEFNATGETNAAESGVLINSTLYVWFANNTLFGTNTTTMSGTYDSSVFSLPNFQLNKDYIWNVKTCAANNTVTECSFTGNRTFTNNFSSFGACGVTPLTTPFLNITFKNETTLEQRINATVDIDFTLWTETQSRNITYSYTNSTEWKEYRFCYGQNHTLNAIVDMDYDNSESQQRTIVETMSLNNGMINKTYYLMPTILGQFVTFQVINLADQIVSGVHVNATKSGALVEDDYTDAAGTVQFFLNPDSSYVLTFSKLGYETYTTTITPSQTSYTITLSGGITSNQTLDYSAGVTYQIRGEYPYNGTVHNFNMSMYSSYWTLDSWGFVLTNAERTSIYVSNTSTANGGFLSTEINVGNNKSIWMDYYYVVDGNYTNFSKSWIVHTSGDTSFSLSNFFTDLKNYINIDDEASKGSGLFGLDSFGLGLIIFILIFVFTGVLSYQFGFRSPETIFVLIFGFVLLFDAVLGLIPMPGRLLQGSWTFLIALIGIWIWFYKEEFT